MLLGGQMAALTTLRRAGWTWLRNLGLVAELCFSLSFWHFGSGSNCPCKLEDGWLGHSLISATVFFPLLFVLFFVTFFFWYAGFVKKCSIAHAVYLKVSLCFDSPDGVIVHCRCYLCTSLDMCKTLHREPLITW